MSFSKKVIHTQQLTDHVVLTTVKVSTVEGKFVCFRCEGRESGLRTRMYPLKLWNKVNDSRSYETEPAISDFLAMVSSSSNKMFHKFLVKLGGSLRR